MNGFTPGRAGMLPLLRRIRLALPQGQTLPDDVWRRRHRWLLGLLWLHVVGLTAFAMVRGYSVGHSLLEGSFVGSFAVLATFAGERKRLASALVSLGLITASATLVHVWGGVIEAHFHFFVMIVLLSLYEDWLPFLLAAAYVVLHHGIAGAIDPRSVYNHPDAIAHPWKWAGIHGFFVLAAGVGSVVAWRLNEDVRAQNRASYARARESEELFKGAFEEAPIGMVLANLDPGHFIQVNRAMCEISGYSEEELLTKCPSDITHPDDRAAGVALAERLLRGDIRRFHVEKRYVRGDGSIVPVLVNVSLVRDSTGAPLYTIAQVKDITERKHAQEQLSFHAYHDVLTGLPNRRRLMEDLEQRITEATTEQPLVLAIFDLDGFKAYNDAFGHGAGDALLVRLGRRLGAAVDGQGTCYRMGGDEFCLLSSEEGVDHDALCAAAASALGEHGDAFTVTASSGAVSLPAEARDSVEALRKADQRMYARKARGRASAGRQATDALLRVLAERSPDLGVHLHDVVQLCEWVGEALELPPEEMVPLLQAAALHDVGKVAIPEAILNKPGPLDDDEWKFIHGHTLIGERIVCAAPALAQAGKVVRSSHERFDGGGYPDGLSGHDIPLAARIIFVCDAFNAMTSDRPYQAAVEPAGALAELRRHAGTQFDPRVVDAFAVAVAPSDGQPADLAATSAIP